MAKCILVVENQDDDRELLKIILSTHGYEVEITLDARQALEQFASQPPDLVVIDTDLPDTSGWVLCERLKHRPESGTVPLLLISARLPLRAQLDGSCADDFIVKPFDEHRLLGKVNHLLRH